MKKLVFKKGSKFAGVATVLTNNEDTNYQSVITSLSQVKEANEQGRKLF